MKFNFQWNKILFLILIVKIYSQNDTRIVLINNMTVKELQFNATELECILDL